MYLHAHFLPLVLPFYNDIKFPYIIAISVLCTFFKSVVHTFVELIFVFKIHCLEEAAMRLFALLLLRVLLNHNLNIPVFSVPSVSSLLTPTQVVL